MARVYPGEVQIKVRSFEFYTQLIGGHETIYVRRKIGEPCDTLHPACRALRLQRIRMANASRAWAKLSYHHKKWWRNQIQWVT